MQHSRWFVRVSALLCGGIAFAVGAAAVSRPRPASPPPERPSSADVCRSHLRCLYIASRKLPAAERRPSPSLSGVWRNLARGFLLLEADQQYLAPGQRGYVVAESGPMVWCLLCEGDPRYGLKIGPALAGDSDFSTSFTWCPDARTLAYCPYHRFAVRRDGVIETR
jgi:hypothetical protein